MEFRIYITVSALPVEDEGTWQPLITALERCAEELGPVIAWYGRDAQIVLSCDASDEAEAAATATQAMADALHAANLGDRYPAGLEVERADAEPVPA